MKKLLTIILFLLLFPAIVSAQEWTYSEFWQNWIATFLGVPREIVEFPTIFWVLLLPYISSVAIIIGILEEIGILRRAPHRSTIYFIIALGWAAFLIPSGFLATVAVALYTFGALWSIIVFMALFFVGGFLLMHTRLGKPGRDVWAAEMGMTKAKWESVGAIDRDIATLTNEVITLEAKGAAITRADLARIAELRRKISELQAKRKDLIGI